MKFKMIIVVLLAGIGVTSFALDPDSYAPDSHRAGWKAVKARPANVEAPGVLIGPAKRRLSETCQ